MFWNRIDVYFWHGEFRMKSPWRVEMDLSKNFKRKSQNWKPVAWRNPIRWNCNYFFAMGIACKQKPDDLKIQLSFIHCSILILGHQFTDQIFVLFCPKRLRFTWYHRNFTFPPVGIFLPIIEQDRENEWWMMLRVASLVNRNSSIGSKKNFLHHQRILKNCRAN